MEAQVTFLEAPVVGMPAVFVLNDRQMISSPVKRIQKDPLRPGWFLVLTASGSAYAGIVAADQLPALQITLPPTQEPDSQVTERTAVTGIRICRKSRPTAAALGILLGAIGAHKFYLSRGRLGWLYLAFCWTFIPAMVGIVEGITYLCMTDAEFVEKYG